MFLTALCQPICIGKIIYAIKHSVLQNQKQLIQLMCLAIKVNVKAWTLVSCDL